MTHHPKVQGLFDWLVDGAQGAPTPMAVVDRVGPELVDAGVPVDRLVAFVRTLHPATIGRRFEWVPGAKCAVSEAPWAMLNSDMFKLSPMARVFTTGEELRRRLGPGPVTEFADLEDLRLKGFTDYLALPFNFMSGTHHGITFATRAPGGFTDEALAALRYVNRALTRVAETLALMRTAVNVLNAYVGREAGDRILKGQIQRGDTESIRCVIWFSDLRGFTTLSGERTPKEIIAVLNEFFDCQVPAVEKHGGQVLKFIGDGLLAIFPLTEQIGAREAGGHALAAAKEAFASLEALNQTRGGRGDAPLKFGVALHVGDVAYGNIGGSARLDFTAIGPAVNLASRIEGLTGKLGKSLLISDELARALPVPTTPAGTFELKGVAAPQAVFEPT